MIHLSLPPQHWVYKKTRTYPVYVLGIQTQLLMLEQHFSPHAKDLCWLAAVSSMAEECSVYGSHFEAID